MRLLYLYKWCTIGGVERVLINRAFVFKKYGIPIKMDIYFYYKGVINDFKKYIEKYNLNEYIDVVEKLDFKKYDYVVSIDTPEAFEEKDLKNLILEYHTSYEDHGSYLKEVPQEKVKLVLVPSDYFKEVLKKRRPDLGNRVLVLRNFVIEEAFDHFNYHLPEWSLKPIVWIGRTDYLKNPHFIVKALRKFRNVYGDKIFFCVVGSSVDEEDFISFIRKEGQIDRVVFYPNITFEKVGAFLRQMSQKEAILVSASKGESFGMAVAEAIYFGLPVLITDIPSHRDLVQNNKTYLYEINNTDEFISKLNNIIQNYDQCKEEILRLRENFTPKRFLDDWENFQRIIGQR
uniref:Glycosyltransferase n=1 Tax=Thermodesulfobacterium geofontis TaxID=1295609 RepID=A0A7C4JRA0_9BACT